MAINPVTILVAEERFLIERELATIEKATLTGGMDELNRSRFTAGADALFTILDVCQSLPMMTDFRLVIVDAGEKLFKRKKSDDEEDGNDGDEEEESPGTGKSSETIWLSYLENPSPSTRLVILATKIDTRMKVWKTAQQKGFVTTLKVPYADKIPSWIEQEARGKGLSITSGASRALADAIGTNLLAQTTTLEKLAVYIQPRTQINEEDVRTMVGDLSRTVFDLARAVGQRRFAQSQHLLENVLLAGEPIQRLFFMVVRHFRLLRLARHGLDRRLGEFELAKLIQVNPFFAKEYVSQAGSFTSASLERIYSELLKTDRKMKRSNPRLALDEFLMKSCSQAGG